MFRGRTFVTIVLVLTGLLTVSVASAIAPAIARPDPVTRNVAVGQTFVIHLYLQDIVDAYGADIRLCFDPTVIEAQDADPNVPGIQIQPLGSFMTPGFVIKKEASNSPDPAREQCKTTGFTWYAFTQINPAPPATGSGPIAAITFKALKTGVSPLTIAYQKAADRSGLEIPTTHLDGSVTVGETPSGYRILLPVILR